MNSFQYDRNANRHMYSTHLVTVLDTTYHSTQYESSHYSGSSCDRSLSYLARLLRPPTRSRRPAAAAAAPGPPSPSSAPPPPRGCLPSHAPTPPSPPLPATFAHRSPCHTSPTSSATAPLPTSTCFTTTRLMNNTHSCDGTGYLYLALNPKPYKPCCSDEP
jgi:hypothetical protein